MKNATKLKFLSKYYKKHALAIWIAVATCEAFIIGGVVGYRQLLEPASINEASPCSTSTGPEVKQRPTTESKKVRPAPNTQTNTAPKKSNKKIE